jgi:hypothetical protein
VLLSFLLKPFANDEGRQLGPQPGQEQQHEANRHDDAEPNSNDEDRLIAHGGLLRVSDDVVRPCPTRAGEAPVIEMGKMFVRLNEGEAHQVTARRASCCHERHRGLVVVNLWHSCPFPEAGALRVSQPPTPCAGPPVMGHCP